jgi:hypothetical protein
LERLGRCPVAAAVASSVLSLLTSKKGMCMSLKDKLRVRRAKEQQLRRHRALLIEGVRTHLLPALVKQGFEAAPLMHRGPVDRDFVLSFPSWGRLVRLRESGVDLIEIQLAPHQRAAFRINAGVVPSRSVPLESDEAVRWLNNEYFETHARPWLRPGLRALGLEPLGAWFSVWLWRHRRPVPRDYDKLALRVAGLVPEIELALRERKLGPHMRRIVIPSELG